MEHTIVVVAGAEDPAPLQYLAPVRGRRDGRGGHGERRRGPRAGPREGRPVRLRRPLQARLGVPRDVPPAAPPARPRGLSGRRLLPAQPPPGAGGAPQRRQRRRVADRPADRRDAGRRRVRLHPHQRHLHHRRPDLPGDGPLQRRPAARPEHRHLGLAGRLRGPDQGDEEGGGAAQAGPRPVPRAGRLRPVRLGPGQGHPGPADPRREAVRDRQAAAVPAAPGREAGRDPLRRHEGPARRHPDAAGQGVRGRLLPVPRGGAAGDPREAGPTKALDDEITKGLDDAVAAYRTTFLA